MDRIAHSGLDKKTIETIYDTPLKLEPTTQYAYRFFHEGLLALADVESHGIHIDTKKCKRYYKKLGRQIERLEEGMEKYEATQIWKRTFPRKFNLDSDPQLKKVLFDKIGLDPVKKTTTGLPATDQEALEKLDYDQDFIGDLLQLRKRKKLRNTYLKNILIETVDNYLYPFFHLHLARTFRSSSSNINFQNIPIRDPELGEIIRSLFLPRPGNHLVELDYGGIEVRGSAWHHKDPVMLDYIADPTKDMHRDMAMQCYLIDSLDKNDKNEKLIRYCGKNMFVFPQFYGDYYKNCANSLWLAIKHMNLKLKDGTPLRKHLKKNKISNYSQFEYHVQEVENDFWGRRFKVYGEWKEQIWEHYCKTGEIHFLTGFVASGIMRKNQVTNAPIQGVAFHTLLWSLIELNKILKKEGWKTKIIGQIHDSIIADVPPAELQNFLALANWVMTVSIRKAWSFIITDLEVEADCTDVDEAWSEKKPIELLKAA